MMKPQDILVLLKLSLPRMSQSSVNEMSFFLCFGSARVQESLKRSQGVGLLMVEPKSQGRFTRTVNKLALMEFLEHGIRYVFPPEKGGETRGVPTSHAAPFFPTLKRSTHLPPVWPTPDGSVRGFEFSPLYPSVPKAAAKDGALYECLVYVDAIRGGKIREREIALKALRKKLKNG